VPAELMMVPRQLQTLSESFPDKEITERESIQVITENYQRANDNSAQLIKLQNWVQQVGK